MGREYRRPRAHFSNRGDNHDQALPHHPQHMMTDAYTALDEAAKALVDDPSVMITDLVLVVGTQSVGESGERLGSVSLYPRDGSQPYYITQGLLHAAMAYIDTTVTGRS